MTARTWSDGTPRSTGNAFDLSARNHSIFFDPKRPPPLPTKKFGKTTTSTVATVKGLSKQGKAQLSQAPQSITIGRKTDAMKRTKASRSAI
jgi:hypothetical protein